MSYARFNKKTQKAKEKASRYYTVLVILLGIIILTVYFNSTQKAHAQSRLDLDDLEVKGELQNDDRLVILSRERNELKNYVKFRTNFRSEIIEELPQPKPGVKY